MKTISISRILEEDHVQDGKEVSQQVLSLKKNLGTISFNEENIIFMRRGVKWIAKFKITVLRVHANGSGSCLLKRII